MILLNDKRMPRTAHIKMIHVCKRQGCRVGGQEGHISNCRVWGQYELLAFYFLYNVRISPLMCPHFKHTGLKIGGVWGCIYTWTKPQPSLAQLLQQCKTTQRKRLNLEKQHERIPNLNTIELNNYFKYSCSVSTSWL